MDFNAVSRGIVGERHAAVDRSRHHRTGGGGDGALVAHVEGDQVWHCVKAVVLELVLDPLVHCVRLQDHLRACHPAPRTRQQGRRPATQEQGFGQQQQSVGR